MRGHEVLNPHEFKEPDDLQGSKWIKWTCWMKHDLTIISAEKPDMLVLLPNWQESMGCKVEVLHALNIGVKVGVLRGDKVYLHHEMRRRRIEEIAK